MDTIEINPCRYSTTVVIPAFNASQTLERAVKSVAESSVNARIVVVNDGSTDNTLATAYELQKTYPIEVLTQENTGLGGARETGGNQVATKYIAFLDADDECHPERLRAQINALESIPSPAIMFCGTQQVFPDLSQREKCCKFSEQNYEDITERYVNATMLPTGPSIMMRTAHYRDLGGFNTKFRRHCEEDFFSRAVANGVPFFCVPKPLYIQHRTSSSNSNQSSGRIDALKDLILLWTALDASMRDKVNSLQLRQFIRKRLLLHAAKSINREHLVRQEIIKIALNTSWPSPIERIILRIVGCAPSLLLRFLFHNARKIR